MQHDALLHKQLGDQLANEELEKREKRYRAAKAIEKSNEEQIARHALIVQSEKQATLDMMHEQERLNTEEDAKLRSYVHSILQEPWMKDNNHHKESEFYVRHATKTTPMPGRLDPSASEEKRQKAHAPSKWNMLVFWNQEVHHSFNHFGFYRLPIKIID